MIRLVTLILSLFVFVSSQHCVAERLAVPPVASSSQESDDHSRDKSSDCHAEGGCFSLTALSITKISPNELAADALVPDLGSAVSVLQVLGDEIENEVVKPFIAQSLSIPTFLPFLMATRANAPPRLIV